MRTIRLQIDHVKLRALAFASRSNGHRYSTLANRYWRFFYVANGDLNAYELQVIDTNDFRPWLINAA